MKQYTQIYTERTIVKLTPFCIHGCSMLACPVAIVAVGTYFCARQPNYISDTKKTYNIDVHCRILLINHINKLLYQIVLNVLPSHTKTVAELLHRHWRTDHMQLASWSLEVLHFKLYTCTTATSSLVWRQPFPLFYCFTHTFTLSVDISILYIYWQIRLCRIIIQLSFFRIVTIPCF